MRGVELGLGNDSPGRRKIFEGLSIDKGTVISGLGAIAATIAGVTAYEVIKHKKLASESPNPPGAKKGQKRK